MNVFEEFKRLVLELEKQAVRYALVGGVAMAFYTEPRFTRDIDLLVDSEDFEKTKGLLEKDGYFESASPWTFPEVAIELHRFLKVADEDDEMLIDILVARNETVRRIIRNAVEAESGEGKVMLVSKPDLICSRGRGTRSRTRLISRSLKMTKIDRVLNKLSELYDFHRKLKAYKIKEKAVKPLKGEAAKDRRAP
jgi:hypothetical protein